MEPMEGKLHRSRVECMQRDFEFLNSRYPEGTPHELDVAMATVMKHAEIHSHSQSGSNRSFAQGLASINAVFEVMHLVSTSYDETIMDYDDLMHILVQTSMTVANMTAPPKSTKDTARAVLEFTGLGHRDPDFMYYYEWQLHSVMTKILNLDDGADE